MKNKTLFFQLLIAILFYSCNNSSTENNDQSFQIETFDSSVINKANSNSINDFKNNYDLVKETNDSLNAPIDIVKVNDTIFQTEPVDNWSIDDFIITYPENYKDELKLDIEYTKEQWENRENPLIVFYRGNDFGDYFHLNFEDVNGENYDFGFGNNSYGEYELYEESDQYNDNPKYLNKKFKVYWNWKVSAIPCCSGGLELAEVYLPSIIKLELIEN